MASADDIQAMLDDVYGVAGIACRWTPAGASSVAFTGLLIGGDEEMRLHNLVGVRNVEARSVKARVSELAALAPGVVPLADDVVAFLDAAGGVTATFVVTGDPRQADPRRLEWTMDLAAA